MAVSVFAGNAIAGAQGRMFSAGDAYERFMGRSSHELAPLVVKFAGLRDGHAVLDVGSGTGALTAAVAAAAPSSHIIGIDPAAPYVAFARARHPGTLIRFEVGDAQQLRFPDGSFDRTLSLLVLNFIPDRAKALDQMIRVTRPGGIVAAAVWDYGEGMEMLRVFWDEAVALRPAAAARDERHMPLSRKGELMALWREHGLQDVWEEALTIGTRFSSFDDYWSPFLEKQGPAGAYVEALAASEREQLRLRLRKRLLGDGPDRPIVLAARAWAVRGIVPAARLPHDRARRRDVVGSASRQSRSTENGFARTAVTASAFGYLREIGTGHEDLVAQIFTSWNPMTSWLEQIEHYRKAAQSSLVNGNPALNL
jgi:SAM-dependent methyltransferase